MNRELRPCPFCDGKTEFIRIGTQRVSCLVTCTNCGCTLETSEEGNMSGSQWNTRISDWQSIYTAPKDGRVILVYYQNEQGKDRIVKARYVNKFTVECDDDQHQADYDENDDPFCPEGWYEQVDNCDDFAELYIQRNITHWMKLPSPPIQG